MQRLLPSIRLLLSKNRHNDFCTTKAISPARGRPKKAKPTPPPYEECSPEPGCSTIVYVDGFYLKDSIKGIGVCWKVDDPRNIGLRLHGTPTIPRAELQAVILALYQAIAAKEDAIIVRSTADNIDNLFAKGWLYDWSKNNWRKKGTTPANLPDLYELDVLMRMIKFRFELLSDSDQSEEWNVAHRCACEVTTSTQTNLAYKQSNHAELYEHVLEAMKAYPSISPLEKFKRTRNLMNYFVFGRTQPFICPAIRVPRMRIGCLRALIWRRTFCAANGTSSATANPSQETVVLVDVITHRQNFYGIGICWGADDVRNVGVRLGGSRNDHPGRINAEMQAVNIALYQAIAGKLTNVVVRGDLSFAADIVRPVQMDTWRQRKWRNKQGSRIIPNARDICEYDALLKMIQPRMDLECTEFDSELKNISHRLACDAKDTETMTEAVYKTKFHPELYAKIQALLDSDTEYPTPAAIDQFKKRRTILKY